MNEEVVDLVRQSDSTILILLVVIIALIIALIPVIKILTSVARAKRQEIYEREKRLIDVIERNTEVNSSLKTLIENDQKYCNDCRKEQQGFFRKLFDNQEIANMKMVEISTKLDRRREMD